MENSLNAVEKLIQKVEIYCKTTLELYKYETANTLVKAVSSLFVIKVVSSILFFFMLFLSIGSALWIGEELGTIYYGFFAVASFYLVIAILLLLFRKVLIKNPITSFVINKLKSENIL